MFDSAANRFIYEDAKSRHDELIGSVSDNGKAYRLGWLGNPYSDSPALCYEYWKAGWDNAEIAKQGEK